MPLRLERRKSRNRLIGWKIFKDSDKNVAKMFFSKRMLGFKIGQKMFVKLTSPLSLHRRLVDDRKDTRHRVMA